MEDKKLLFKAYPKQQEFFDAVASGRYTFLCYGGAMGGGKSYASIAILILLCRLYPNSKWVVIRDSVPTLKRTAIETFKKVCPTNFLKSFNQVELIAEFKNGSRLMFMAEDWINDKDFDRFKGLEVNGFLLEQIEELQEGLLDVCLVRAGRHRITPMPRPVILATVNPTQNWVKKKIYEAYINETLPEDWFYLPATIIDNEELSGDDIYMNNLRRLDDINYRRFVLGDWSAFSVDKPFAYAFDEAKHVGSCQFNPSQHLHLSFDFNVSPITCIAAQHYGNTWYILREFRIENSNIYELCDRIKATYPKAAYLVTGDATGAGRSALTDGVLNYYTVIKRKLWIGDNQILTPRVNPSHADSSVLYNSILQNYNVIYDRDLCPYLIQDNKYVEMGADNSIDKSGEKKKEMRGHLLDCNRYLWDTFMSDYLKRY